MRRAWCALTVLSLALAGCVSYTPPVASPLASPESDAQAKQFAPPAGSGYLYVQRADDELVTPRQPTACAVAVDGRELGGILPGMYYCVALTPGTHKLSAQSDAGYTNTMVSVEAGRSCFYQITTRESAYHSVKVSLGWVILEPVGKAMIIQSKRAQPLGE